MTAECDIIAAMLFQVRIQNLGKLADATVRVGGLTVLAGVNNTGKTFFSKSLYSVVRALNADPVMTEFNDRAEELHKNMQHLTSDPMFAASSPPTLAELIKAVDQMELAAKESSAQARDSVVAPEKTYPALTESAQKMSEVYEQLNPTLKDWAHRGAGDSQFAAVKFSDEAAKLYFLISNNVDSLCDLGKMTAGEIASFAFRYQVNRNLLNNFQVQNVNDLKGEQGNIAIHLNGERVLCFDERGDNVVRSPTLPQMRRRSNSFFLDSPALWRMKEILHGVLLESRNGRARADVPDYFRALFVALLKKYSGDIPFPEVFRRLTEDVIRGKIVQDDFGRLFYAETDKGVYPLWQVATGVVNIGILALLIERKILDPGAFLFIDEPESNLHPAWQVEMVRALFELAQGGVNVVLATHSVDIVKYLDVHLQEHPELKELVELNHFTREGVVGGDKDFGERVDDIMLSLTDPFHKLRLEEIRASWSPS